MMNVQDLYNKDVSWTMATEIARRFFGDYVEVFQVLRSSFLFECGHVRLRVMRDVVTPGYVHCGVEVFEKRVGYFNFNVQTHVMSQLWKDD